MNKHQMKLEARNLLEEKLLALMKIMFDIKILLLLNDQEGKEVCKNNYTTLKLNINHLKIKINEIENLIEKYCKEEKE